MNAIPDRNRVIVSYCGEYGTYSVEWTTDSEEGLDGGLGQLKQVARENASPTPFFSFGSLSFA